MKTQMNFLLSAILSLLFFIQPGQTQETRVPSYFKRIEQPSLTPQEQINEAQRRNQASEKAKRFWFGYQFDLRNGIEFNHFCIHDNGGISITRGEGGFFIYEEADLEIHVQQALSELGDEKAKEFFEKKKQEFFEYAKLNSGLFFLFDAGSKRVKKVKLLHFRQKRFFDDYPVYWAGNMDTNASVNYITELVNDNRYIGEVIKPVIFVLSLHDHPRVIPLLTDLAGGERYVEIRKSAAFWLGQIPEEASFEALVQLFEKERNRKMKQKLVFSIGQHKSKKVIGRLAKIAVEDEDFKVREKAVFWLGQVESEESLDVLLDLTKKSEDTGLKEKIVFSISQHGSKDATNVLIEIAKSDKNRDVRKKAIFWLGQKAGHKTLKALGDIVESAEETEVKTKAVFAISQHQDRDLAFQMLMDIAKQNRNPRVRKKAIFWMGQMGDARAVDFFKEILTNN